MAVTVRWRQPLDPDTPRRPRQWRTLTLILVGLGGATGTAVRSQLERAFPAATGTWPWATFWINVSGALVLGALLETLSLLGPDQGWRRRVRLGVGTGVLGGFTTYSSFVVETVVLGRGRQYVTAAGYDLASLLLGFAAAYAGTLLVSAVHRRTRHQQMVTDR